MNSQPREPRVAASSLSVHSIFRTIQGEGPFCGTPAAFIRLAGCNLQCPGCDTDYITGRFEVSVASIVGHVNWLQTGGLVVITGGEPFRQNLVGLLTALVLAGYYVQIETNGTLKPAPFNYNRDPALRQGVYIVCSPKAGMHSEIERSACAMKYVLAYNSVNEHDGLPLTVLGSDMPVARPPVTWKGPIYLQPMDAHDPETNDANIRAVVRSCMTHGYILQLQIHKLIGME